MNFSGKEIDKDLIKQAYVIYMQDVEYDQLKDREENDFYNKYSIKIINDASKSIRFYTNSTSYLLF